MIILVMVPITLALCKKLKLDPSYFRVGMAVMANLQGTATLAGDPPSMIFADHAGYGFNDFFFYAGKPSIFLPPRGYDCRGAFPQAGALYVHPSG
jgi:Na+/H+ antiporter NhaD/arsenite permease-like protein